MNKKQKKTIKTSIIICSLVIPMAMLFGFLIPPGKAGPQIPDNDPPDPYNKWKWEKQGGDSFWFEIEIVAINNETDEILMAQRTLNNFDITSITNTTEDILGLTEVSQINVTEYSPGEA